MFSYTSHLSISKLEEYAAEFRPLPCFSRMYLYSQTLRVLDKMRAKMVHEAALIKKRSRARSVFQAIQGAEAAPLTEADIIEGFRISGLMTYDARWINELLP